MREVLMKGVEKIAVVAGLLDALHAKGINYCHWKSNEHLLASMTGDTDLDVLFDMSQRQEVEHLLHEKGFKKFDAIRQKQYKDIVDFLGLDFETGKLVHVHTHYKLTLGEPFLKGYQLDLEDKILDSKVWDDEFGIYRSHPAFELVLLYLRESLKLRTRDIILMHAKGKINYNDFILKEYRWLKERTNDEEVKGVLKQIFKSPSEELVKLFTGEFNRRELLKLAPILRKEFQYNRMYSPLQARMVRWYREGVVVFSRKITKIFNIAVLSKRINPRGGIVIAVIGADGSGKSTVTTSLRQTFATKLDVFRIYFGRGDGKSSTSRKMLTSIKGKGDKKSGRSNAGGATNRKPSFAKTIYKSMEALLVAREKTNNLRLMSRAKNQRALVICDRFPQYQIMGYNDGPLLNHLKTSANPLFRYVASREERVYRNAEKSLPDLVIKLIAEAEIVEARKPGETSLEKLDAKISGIKQLQFSEPCKVLTIDASIPLQEVLMKVRKAVWDLL